MLKETEITINATKSIKAKYDECAKALFKNPEILAPILKYVVPEYKDYTAEEIVDFIVKDSIDEPPVDSVSTMANQLGTEMNSLGEKKICYDMHFKAINPKLSNSKTTIYLHMDLEIQNDYRPGNPKYPIVKRGIYYGAREISSQLGVLTGKTNYNDVEKVYSVWICNENIPKELQNTVTEYTIKKNEVIGKVDEPEADYDLLSVIMVRLGSNEGKEEIFDYLNSVFKGDVEKVKEYIDIDTIWPTPTSRWGVTARRFSTTTARCGSLRAMRTSATISTWPIPSPRTRSPSCRSFSSKAGCARCACRSGVPRGASSRWRRWRCSSRSCCFTCWPEGWRGARRVSTVRWRCCSFSSPPLRSP